MDYWQMPPNVMYLSYHIGTWVNIDAIAEANGWNLLHVRPPHGYHMTEQVADEAWTKYYKDFFETQGHTFTHIIVSDTIPCCIPLFNYIKENQHVTMILHVTNFFNYDNDNNSWYYQKLNEIIALNNVHVIYVDPFQGGLLKHFGIGGQYIPLSGKTTMTRYRSIVWDGGDDYYEQSSPIVTDQKIGARITYQNVYNFFDKDKIYMIPSQYGGPSALSNFHAIIYFPYHYSTISLHEFLSNGKIVIIPTYRYLRHITGNAKQFEESLCDAYNGPCAHLFLYFDNKSELDRIIDKIYNYPQFVKDTQKHINEYMHKYDNHIFSIWRSII
jgi:hypothetical protein